MYCNERMLTEDERKLVEDNHDLIYMVSDCLDIDIDDYYGVLAIGLCHAAQNYNKRKHKHAFDEFAKIHMTYELCLNCEECTGCKKPCVH